MWTAFTGIESWTAIAASPDARVVARCWRDGRGGSGILTIDLATGEETSQEMEGRTVVAVACSSLHELTAVTVDDDTLTQRLTVVRAGASIMMPLDAGRWTVSTQESGTSVAICCHDGSKPLLIISGDGQVTPLPLHGLTVTSVVGVRKDILWVNAFVDGSAGDVRLTMVDLTTGRHVQREPGLLGVLLGRRHLVTTTTGDPETVQIRTIDTPSPGVAVEAGVRNVSLRSLDGTLALCAVSRTGNHLLIGVRHGIDDSCWLVDTATARAERLSDESLAFGSFGVFDADEPCWLTISPSGRLELARRRRGADAAQRPDALRSIIEKPGVPWTSEVGRMRTSTPGVNTVTESLVLARPESDRDHDLVVVMLHGGPRARWSRKYDQTLQLMVGAGFRVVAPNTRGSSSDDRSFEQALDGRWGDVDQEDLAAVLAHVRRESPRTRILLVGMSYGAYQAFHTVLADPDSLDGAVLAAGFPSPERLFAEGAPSTKQSLARQRAIPSTWARGRSPRPATGLPVWIVHGQADHLIPAHLGEEMAVHLHAAGADVEITIVPDAGHQVFDADAELHEQLVRFAQRIARVP